MFSSRGCPYNCSFCASTRFWKNNVRFFSAEYVVNEIKELVNKYHVNSIFFYDDLFIANKTRLKKIVELLKKENLLNKVQFSCACRANLVKEDVIILLKKMNVKSVGMGLESGCDKSLKYLKGDNITVKDNQNAINILKKYGISVSASFIIGNPKETKKEILETFDFIKKNNLDFVEIYVLTPFPGTPVWNYAKNKGLVSEDMDWDKLNVVFKSNYNDAIIVSETLTREELYKLILRFDKMIKFIKLKRLLKHPFTQKVPLIVFNKTKEKMKIIFKSI